MGIAIPLPEITTARLRLQPAQGHDLDELHALWITPDVRKFLWDDQVISRTLAATTLERSSVWFERYGYGLWLMRECRSVPIIGFCGLRPGEDSPDPELLYGLARSHWGQGLATEAAHAVLRYGFEGLGLERIRAVTDARNVASVAMMQRLAMDFQCRETVEGLDLVTYGLSRQQFNPGTASYQVHRA